ncbi:unnamed protein product, partial [Ixodes pacificus]
PVATHGQRGLQLICFQNRKGYGPISFDAMAVLATFTTHSWPSSSTEVVRCSWMYLQASLQTTQGNVVPSPTSWSCKSASSTSTFAAGCSTSRSFKMVAPSFVIVTSCGKVPAKQA